MAATGQISSMLCFSPDFTHPDPDERRRQVARQHEAIDLTVRLGTTFCRTLSGQNVPGLSRADGMARTVDGLLRSIEYAERRGVTLCLENHYKDGTWRYPEFAQPEEIYLEILDRVDSPRLGVQYDPSNAIVGGYDPIRFLDRVLPRVVTMHASDRWLVPGATLDELRRTRRFHRLLRQAAARGGGEGDDRLRRDLHPPRARRVHRMDFDRGRDERARRAAAVGGFPAGQDVAILPSELNGKRWAVPGWLSSV